MLNLSNKSNYDYSASEVNKIIYAIESEFKILKMKFRDKVKNNKDFKL